MPMTPLHIVLSNNKTPYPRPPRCPLPHFGMQQLKRKEAGTMKQEHEMESNEASTRDLNQPNRV